MKIQLNPNPYTLNTNPKGFTLLELLIVVAIIVILAGIVFVVLNPAETLRKTRDSQRISDLNTLKSALSLYLTTYSSPDLDASIATHCLTDTTGATTTTAKISYSAQIADAACIANVVEGGDVATGATFDSLTDWCRYVGTSGASAVNGTGWVPVNLTVIVGGTPLSNFPLDPTNTVATPTAPASTDLVYRYACQNSTSVAGKPSYVFELDAQLESQAYTTGSDDKRANDGGDTATLLEVGNSLNLMSGTNY